MAKIIFAVLFWAWVSTPALGQTSDSMPKELNEVTVTGFTNEASGKSPLNVSLIKPDSLYGYNEFNVCDVLKHTAGVSSLSTGIGIVKPVIRGLYGNRILVLLNGLKFDNQQWQEEHGLGLSSFGLSKIELIKGPIGVLYGTEAIGGVINLIDYPKPSEGSRVSDFAATINSNTLGGMFDAGYAEGKKNSWLRLRIGVENNADYSDGNNQRILNSRFDGYYFKTTFGFERKNWVSINNYSASFNRFGFIFNDVYNFISPDNRWSRTLTVNPAHLVLLNIASSENKIHINSKLELTANLGIQSNERMENEGGGDISLNMHLLTIQNLLKFNYWANQKHSFSFSMLQSFEDNTNFGSRKIVPDANMQEGNISVNYAYIPDLRWLFEAGAGIGEKFIKTYFTADVNGQGKEVQPFNKFSLYYNFFSGLSYTPNQRLILKTTIATGVRVANLAELSSNGLHEGIFTYEIGNPLLKNEQVYSVNLSGYYNAKSWGISVSPFYNYFTGYIYLTQVDEEWFGFPVYRYKQQNAAQTGVEISGFIRPYASLEVTLAYSGMMSKTRDGNYTPYVPAQKLKPELNYKFYVGYKHQLQLNTNIEYSLPQNQTAPYEIRTGEYFTWNAGISSANEKTITLGLSCNNILNRAYTDNLSRLKYFGLKDIGRNFVVRVKYIFKICHKN